FHIAFERKTALLAGVGYPGDPDVDNDRSFFYHGGPHEFRFAQRSNDDIGLLAELLQIPRPRMTKSNRTITGIGIGTQQDTHRPANNIAAAHDYGMHPARVYFIMFQQEHNAMRGGRNK